MTVVLRKQAVQPAGQIIFRDGKDSDKQYVRFEKMNHPHDSNYISV